uniref:GPCR A44 n=1 Tax=Nilaparvata lugens TaxID=108931 RepID=A0A5B9CUQ6_NILLU|nr:GPCR A44 [Nilaparvata lugens]
MSSVDPLLDNTQTSSIFLENSNSSSSIRLNGTNEDAFFDYDYPSLEVVEPPIQVALVILFSVTATLSLSGNVTVIIVLSLGKRSSSDLKAFLINLAVSDVTMAAFSIPFTYTMFLLGRWIFPPWFCPIVMTMQHVSVIVSVYTLMAIGIDRYKAVMYPLNLRARKCRNKLIIAAIWIMAGSVSAIQLYVSEAKPFKYDRQWHYECSEQWTSEDHSKIYTVFIFSFTFGIPLIGLAYTYTSIAWRMWKRSSPGNADPDRDMVQLKSKKKVIKMLFTIVILFTLFWLPLQTFVVLFYFVPDFGNLLTEQQRRIYALSYFGCLWLANANSFVNPLVYCFMSDNFRADLKDLSVRLCGHEKINRFRGSTASGSTRTTICLTQHTPTDSLRPYKSKLYTQEAADHRTAQAQCHSSRKNSITTTLSFL